MKHKTDYPDWFFGLREKGPIRVIVVCFLFVAVVIGLAWFLDYRLDQIESRVKHVPPRSYRPPVVEDYPVGDIDVESLPVRQSVYVPVYSHVYYQGGSLLTGNHA